MVEIDPETGEVEIVDYAAVDDCGIRIHPQIVEGQVHGATAHALGAALHETFAYDEYGQLLTANFYDYHVPHALDMPQIKTGHIESPSPFSSLGTKGMGEGGGAAIHAICAAIQDALRARGKPGGRLRLPQPGRAGLADDPGPGGDGGSRGGDAAVKVEGTKEFDAPAQIVWDVLNDPSQDGEAAARRRELRGPGRPALVGHRQGPARHGRPEAQLQVREARGAADRVREAERRRARASARSSRWRPSSISRPDGDRTSMSWEADVHVAGPIGSMGQRVFQPIVNQQVGNVLDALEGQVDEAKVSA